MIEVKTEEEILNLKSTLKKSENQKTKYIFECSICKKKSERRVFSKSTKLICSTCLTKQSMLERFGVENVSQSKEIQEKKKNTSLKHFGVENPMKSKKVLETLKKNNLERSGVDNVAKLESSKEKSRSTCKEKYGETHFAKTEIFKNQLKEVWGSKTEEELNQILEKRKQTYLEKYGVENFNNREKYKQTCFEKYGQFNPMLVESIKKDIENRNLEKYGVKYLMDDPRFQEKIRKAWLEKNLNSASEGEKEIQEFLKSLNVEFRVNDRFVLEGKELDIYIPSKKIGIEYNGLYWHSDYDKTGKNVFPSKEEKEKARNRHLIKTNLCKEKGIRLIHIFEDDWKFKKDIVKSILKNALGFTDCRLFARKCELKNISLEEYGIFLKENHLQGYSFADLRLGLFYKGELVQCVGVNTKGTHSKEAELVRMCVKNGYSIIGGFSKLINHLNLDRIVSHVDISIFSGSGYEAVGFKPIKLNKPTYFYTTGKIREPRYHYMRKHIEQKYKKGELKFFDPNLTEEDNMYSNGYARIWNCGTLKVEWLKQ